MHVPSSLIKAGAVTLYGVGCYALTPTGSRYGDMMHVRLYTTHGPAKAFRTREQNWAATEVAKYGPQAILPREWVVFRVAGRFEEIP